MNNESTEDKVIEIYEMFKVIQKALKCKLEKIAKEYGLTPAQLSIIFYLYEYPSVTLNGLSEHLMLTKSTVSGVVDRLTRQGAIIREIPRDNRRIVKLSISEEFKKNNDICSMKKKLMSELVCNLDSVDFKEIVCGLRQFRILLDK